MDRVIDLSFKKYEDLLYEGNVDDQSYSDWYNQEVRDWLLVAKNRYNQDYIIVKGNKKVYKEYYVDWYYEEV
jgi:hypothetical protein